MRSSDVRREGRRLPDWNGPARFVSLLACVALGACRLASPSGGRASPVLLVVAPHPDDEVLMAGALVAEARARGERVAVAVLTNGDARCNASGYTREAETLAAMRALGVAAADVHFLGYPDGALDALGHETLAPVGRRDASGACVKGSTTYADRTNNVHTVSFERLGHESPYRSDALVEDLAWVVERTAPTRIVTAHPADDHPDHAATGLFVYRALERLPAAAPEVLFSIVHAGPCWPTEERPDCPVGAPRPFERMPALPEGLASYAPDLRVRWPEEGPARVAALVGAYASQLGSDPPTNWLQSFVRADQVLFRSHFRCAGQAPRRCEDPRYASASATPAALAGGGTVPWPPGVGLALEPGIGLRIEDGAHVRRVCAHLRADGREVIDVERFRVGHIVDGEADAYRRFVVVPEGTLRLTWAAESAGVVGFDLADARGSVGRRLEPMGGPFRVRRDESCSHVP